MDHRQSVRLFVLVLAGCTTVTGEPIREAPPEEASSTKRVFELSAEEAEAWCSWYVLEVAQVPGAAPPEPQQDVDGLIDTYETRYCYAQPFNGACLIRPTVADCARNLLLFPCEATLDELSDCVHGMLDGHRQSGPCPISGSCDAFAQAPGCELTVVSPIVDDPMLASGSGCPLHVE